MRHQLITRDAAAAALEYLAYCRQHSNSVDAVKRAAYTAALLEKIDNTCGVGGK